MEAENQWKEVSDIVGGRVGVRHEPEGEVMVSASGKVVALKVRFVLLSDALIMEVKHRNEQALGYFFAETPTKTPIIEIMSSGKVHRFLTKDFENIKQALKEFVENNCFHGNETPVPRIERSIDDKCYLFDGEDSPLVMSPRQLSNIISLVAGEKRKFPIYEDKPQFTSEWKKIYPRGFHFTDFGLPEEMESEFVGLSVDQGKTAAALINLKNKDMDIEIWEFTVWSK